MSSITCPYCGHVNCDLHEYDLDDGQITTIQCEGCDRELEISCSVNIAYKVHIPAGKTRPGDLTEALWWWNE